MIRRAICWPVTSSRQCTQASDWSLAPDAGLWLAESSVSHCSLSRGANWNEWVLMRVWRQGDTRHNQGASWDQQMEIEIQNKCNHWSFVMWSTLYYFVTLRKSAPVEIYWHLTSSQQFFQQNTKWAPWSSVLRQPQPDYYWFVLEQQWQMPG